MQNKFQLRKGMRKFAKNSFISGIVTTIGYFVVKDLKNENSIIINSLKKIPYIKKYLDNYKNKFDNNNIEIINNSNIKEIKGDDS